MRVRVSRRGLGAAGERARDSRKGDLSNTALCHMCVQTVEQLKFSLNSVQHTDISSLLRVFTVIRISV